MDKILSIAIAKKNCSINLVGKLHHSLICMNCNENWLILNKFRVVSDDGDDKEVSHSFLQMTETKFSRLVCDFRRWHCCALIMIMSLQQSWRPWPINPALFSLRPFTLSLSISLHPHSLVLPVWPLTCDPEQKVLTSNHLTTSTAADLNTSPCRRYNLSRSIRSVDNKMSPIEMVQDARIF